MRAVLERQITRAALAWERLARPRARIASAGAPWHVLVLHFPSKLGISVHETPLFEALQQIQPPLRVTVATNALGAQVLNGSPFIDRLLTVPTPMASLRGAVTALRRALSQDKAHPVDCVLTGAFDRQRAVVRLAWLAVPAWRGGFTENAEWMQRPLVFDEGQSVIANNLQAAALVGWSGTPPEPRVFFTEQDLRHATQLLEQAAEPERPRLMVLSQGAEPQQGWLEDRMVQVLRHAREVLGYELFFDGMAGDTAVVERLQAQTGGYSLAGKTRIGQLAALLASSDLVLSVHSGPMNVTRAVGTPMLALAPKYVNLVHWDPVAAPHITVLQGSTGHPVPEDYRMQELETGPVIAALSALAARFPASEQARAARVGASLVPQGHGLASEHSPDTL